MTSTPFTVRGARDNLGAVLDQSQSAHPSTVVPNGHEFAVVDKAPLLRTLRTFARPQAEIRFEDGACVIMLDGLPFAAEGTIQDEALALLFEDLRDYADEWSVQFQNTPNHSGNRALVTVISLLDDNDLSDWIVGT